MAMKVQVEIGYMGDIDTKKMVNIICLWNLCLLIILNKCDESQLYHKSTCQYYTAIKFIFKKKDRYVLNCVMYRKLKLCGY